MRPLYLPLADAPLFAVEHEPPPGVEPRGRILLAPPIGEELNRCRLAISTAARRWAGAGWSTLVVDLYGTGDSPGDFGEATVGRWQDDLRHAWDWLLKEVPGGESVLWAVRGGALLGLSLLADLAAQRIVLWAPQFTGKEAVDSVLRLATTADALGQQPGQAPVRERIRQSGLVEIGGYRWSEALLSGLERLDEDRAESAPGHELLWLEPQGRLEHVAPGRMPGREPRPVAGAAFWRTAEPVAAEEWAVSTGNWLRREAP